MPELEMLTEEFVAFNRSALALHYGIDATPEAVTARLARADTRGFLTVRDPHLVAGAAAYRFPLTVRPGRALPAAGLGEVAVLPSHRRRGLLRDLVGTHLRTARAAGAAVAVLHPSEGGIYGRFGYTPVTADCTWELDLRTARPALLPHPGRPATTVLLEPEERAAPLAAVFAAHQGAHPGELGRDPAWWHERLAATASARCILARTDDGTPAGYALWRRTAPWHPHTGGAPVAVEELVAPAPGAARALLDFLLQLDLCTRVELRGRPLHEPLRHLLADPRALRLTAGTDSLWARILDLPRLLETRLDAPERELTIDVADPLDFAAGLHTVTARPDGSTGCTSARRVPDLSLDVADLAAVLLGDTRPADLLAAGRLREHTTDSADLFARALGHRAAPHCSTRF